MVVISMRYITIRIFLLQFCLFATQAIAQVLPKVSIPGQQEDQDVLSSMLSLLVLGGKVTLLAIGALSIVIICWQLVASFLQARDNNSWGKFGITFLIGAIVLLFIGTVSQLGWSYLESIANI